MNIYYRNGGSSYSLHPIFSTDVELIPGVPGASGRVSGAPQHRNMVENIKSRLDFEGPRLVKPTKVPDFFHLGLSSNYAFCQDQSMLVSDRRAHDRSASGRACATCSLAARDVKRSAMLVST